MRWSQSVKSNPSKADGARLSRTKRSREDDFDDEDEDKPRRRGRSKSDDQDGDERPRKRGARVREGDGPWLIAALAAPACFLLTLGGAFLINGTAGLPAGNDGPAGKLMGLGIGFLVSLVLMTLGILGVKNRHAYSKWGTEIKGGMAVALGMVQAVMGGLIGGFCLYGLVFTLLNGR
jgi:hypothetical protein